MKHYTSKPLVLTRFRKMDDVFVPIVPVVHLPPPELFEATTSKRSVAASLVIMMMFSSLFISAGKQMGTLAYFSDTEMSQGSSLRAGTWVTEEFVLELESFSLMMDEALLVEEVPSEGEVAGVETEEPVVEEPVLEEETPAEETPVEEIPPPIIEEPTTPEEPVVEPPPAGGSESESPPQTEPQPEPAQEPPPAETPAPAEA